MYLCVVYKVGDRIHYTLPLNEKRILSGPVLARHEGRGIIGSTFYDVLDEQHGKLMVFEGEVLGLATISAEAIPPQ